VHLSCTLRQTLIADKEVLMENEVFLKKDGFVAEIVLNRPAKLNAVTPAMAAPLEALCG
jgi:enoyl-CoA hydratase/carnithine racemase